MSRISADDVRKVAKLARLELPDDKIATYTGQLERILDYVAHLEQVDTEGVPPTTRAVEVVNVTRPDRVEPTPVREELLKNAASAATAHAAAAPYPLMTGASGGRGGGESHQKTPARSGRGSKMFGVESLRASERSIHRWESGRGVLLPVQRAGRGDGFRAALPP